MSSRHGQVREITELVDKGLCLTPSPFFFAPFNLKSWASPKVFHTKAESWSYCFETRKFFCLTLSLKRSWDFIFHFHIPHSIFFCGGDHKKDREPIVSIEDDEKSDTGRHTAIDHGHRPLLSRLGSQSGQFFKTASEPMRGRSGSLAIGGKEEATFFRGHVSHIWETKKVKPNPTLCA